MEFIQKNQSLDSSQIELDHFEKVVKKFGLEGLMQLSNSELFIITEMLESINQKAAQKFENKIVEIILKLSEKRRLLDRTW